MKSSQLTSAAIGVGAVLLAYAVYKTFAKPAASGTRTGPSLGAVSPGGVYSATNPGQVLSTDELIYGAATGSPWDSYATTDQLIDWTVYGNDTRSPIKVGYW